MIKFIGNANLFERLNVEFILILLIQSFLHENNNHNHLGNAVSSEIRLFEETIRDRAVNYDEPTQTVIDNCLNNLSDDTVARIPKFKHIKRNIQNLRNKNNLPKIPQDKTFDRIPDILVQKKTKR
ncbi:unnamed protein product [Rotaria sp. Silwood2]|nr:unnamed protein product [Rotaria sp. Silwood2]CAF4063807.1 unnamed protein product [Rotaria sp. Silwood2]